MKLSDYLSSEQFIELGENVKKKKDIIHRLVQLSQKTGEINNVGLFEKNVLLREQISTTGLGNGIAIPHSKDKTVDDLFCVFMRTKKPVSFDALDGQPVDLFFMIGSPIAKAMGEYLELLARVLLFANDEDRRERIRTAVTAAEVMKLVNDFDKI